ncbi:hypothetical protein WISP_133345 [Willisornis vidua]|uniref:Uncharacterized protein n=1 Tax=Willisornis vidua TaxID=1566151 RepID=A0ABQ9CV60_9PASS|nr:hypothetical protein WISP_133345 [Willisornis vidua]
MGADSADSLEQKLLAVATSPSGLVFQQQSSALNPSTAEATAGTLKMWVSSEEELENDRLRTWSLVQAPPKQLLAQTLQLKVRDLDCEILPTGISDQVPDPFVSYFQSEKTWHKLPHWHSLAECAVMGDLDKDELRDYLKLHECCVVSSAGSANLGAGSVET